MDITSLTTTVGMGTALAGAIPDVPGGDEIKKQLNLLLEKPENKGFLGKAASFFSGLWQGLREKLAPFVSPNSYNAELVIDAKIDAWDGFKAIADKCGNPPGLVDKLKKIYKDYAHNHVGWIMPSDPSSLCDMMRGDDNPHAQATALITNALLDVNQNIAHSTAELQALRDNLTLVAGGYASACEGIDPVVCDTTKMSDAAAADNFTRRPPTKGLAAMMLNATIDAMGKPDAQGVDRDSKGNVVTGTFFPIKFLGLGGPPTFSADPAQHNNLVLALDDTQIKTADETLAKITTPQPLQGPSQNVDSAPPGPASGTVTNPPATGVNSTITVPPLRASNPVSSSLDTVGVPPVFTTAANTGNTLPNRAGSSPTAGV